MLFILAIIYIYLIICYNYLVNKEVTQMQQGRKTVRWLDGLVRPASPSSRDPSPSLGEVAPITPVMQSQEASPDALERAGLILAAFNIAEPSRGPDESDESIDQRIALYSLRLVDLARDGQLLAKLARIEREEAFIDTTAPGRYKTRSFVVQALRNNTQVVLQNLMSSPDYDRFAAFNMLTDNLVNYAEAERLMRANPWLQELQDLSGLTGSLEADVIEYVQNEVQNIFESRLRSEIRAEEATSNIVAMQEKYDRLQALFESRALLETLEKLDELFTLRSECIEGMRNQSIESLIDFVEGDLNIPDLDRRMVEGLRHLDRQLKADLIVRIGHILAHSEDEGRGILLAALSPVAKALRDKVAHSSELLTRDQWIKIRTFKKALDPDEHSSMRLLLALLDNIQGLMAVEGSLGAVVIRKLQQKTVAICQNLRFINGAETALTIPAATAQIQAHFDPDAMRLFLEYLEGVQDLSGVFFAQGSLQNGLVRRLQQKTSAICQNLDFMKEAAPGLSIVEANAQIQEHCENTASLVAVLSEILALTAPAGSAELAALSDLKQKAQSGCTALIAESDSLSTTGGLLQDLNSALQIFKIIRPLWQVGGAHHEAVVPWSKRTDVSHRRKVDKALRSVLSRVGNRSVDTVDTVVGKAVEEVRIVGAIAEHERRNSLTSLVFGRSPSPLVAEINLAVQQVYPAQRFR